jgi:murein DD-endopeptidase MepM/ murein hydrolase activator NlpD
MKEHKITNGELIAKYNLSGYSKGQCLFAKNYGDIVNVEIHNNRFIKHLPKKLSNKKLLSVRIVNKLNELSKKLKAIDSNIIDKSGIKTIEYLAKNSRNNMNLSSNVSNLAKADYIMRDLPIFMPLERPLLTSKFGIRKHPKKKCQKFHQGIDIASSKYSHVYAAADGIVKEVGRSPSYGNYILIKHRKNIDTRYAHLSKLNANLGRKIFQGEFIGVQGSTGSSTSDHLHFEIIHKNKPIDPMNILSREYYCRKS